MVGTAELRCLCLDVEATRREKNAPLPVGVVQIITQILLLPSHVLPLTGSPSPSPYPCVVSPDSHFSPSGCSPPRPSRHSSSPPPSHTSTSSCTADHTAPPSPAPTSPSRLRRKRTAARTSAAAAGEGSRVGGSGRDSGGSRRWRSRGRRGLRGECASGGQSAEAESTRKG